MQSNHKYHFKNSVIFGKALSFVIIAETKWNFNLWYNLLQFEKKLLVKIMKYPIYEKIIEIKEQTLKSYLP